jgi:hypothetical protein
MVQATRSDAPNLLNENIVQLSGFSKPLGLFAHRDDERAFARKDVFAAPVQIVLSQRAKKLAIRVSCFYLQAFPVRSSLP